MASRARAWKSSSSKPSEATQVARPLAVIS
jgi:hypothetical protein